jgi:hypothetical protein
MKRPSDEVALKLAIDALSRTHGSQGRGEISVILYRVLTAAELSAPASEQGAFIAAGNELDAYAAIAKVLATAEKNILVVDPYIDGKALADFIPAAVEKVVVRILSDESSLKPTLVPAYDRWKAQFGDLRPLELRLAPARSLHDRLLIIDDTNVWSLTQSLKDFANRADASIMKADPEIGALKIAAYHEHWESARVA